MKSKNEVKNEIKSYLATSGWSLTDIVAKMNESLPEDKKTTVQNLSNKLSRGSIRYAETKELAEIVGYEIKWIKKDEQKRVKS